MKNDETYKVSFAFKKKKKKSNKSIKGKYNCEPVGSNPNPEDNNICECEQVLRMLQKIS